MRSGRPASAARDGSRGRGHDSVMTRDELIAHCLSKPGAWLDEPWKGDLVAKVAEKIFAFTSASSVGVKCGANCDEADEWLRQYPEDASVMAYLGRSGWNTLRLADAIPDDELLDAVDASYDYVVAKLPRSRRP